MIDRTAATLHLRDGRRIGYAEYGDPSGQPLVYFHGTPGSRLELGLPGVDGALAELGVRAIAPDRPGIGLSAFRPRRRILDWPDDVAQIADALGLERFMVLGASGGGPYALACGHRLAARVTALGVVAGIAPIDAGPCWEDLSPRNRQLFRMGRWFSAGLKPTMRAMSARVSQAPDVAADELLDRLPEPDRGVLGRGEVRAVMGRAWREAFHQGADGPWWDFVLQARRWRFSLAEVTTPVLLWIGGADLTVPPSMGRYLAAALPRSEARFYPAEGHFSLVVNRYREIIEVLAARSRGLGSLSPAA